jgi:hypothetical protein
MAELIAIVCAGLWAGSSFYSSVIELPAAGRAGPAVSIPLFREMVATAAPIYMFLVFVGSGAGIYAWVEGSGVLWLIGAILMLAMFPLTALFIVPTSRKMLELDTSKALEFTEALMKRWRMQHLLRAALGGVAFVVFAVDLTL